MAILGRISNWYQIGITSRHRNTEHNENATRALETKEVVAYIQDRFGVA
jgi:hypothetical protein